MGMALMGTGIANGEHRAVEAAQRAISSTLLEDTSIEGAKGVLINITGGPDMTLFEVSEASSIVQKAADPEANIIFGTVIDPEIKDRMKITVIATGFHRDEPSATAQPQEPPHAQEPQPSASQPEQPRFWRGSRFGTPVVDFETGGGYGPNSRATRDDLDVPTFLRKQMD